jgi:hypothetical protein
MKLGPVSYRQIVAAFISQTLRSIKKSKVNYALGFSACLLVVFVVALLVSILSKSPLIFLRLSELNSGEVDLHISAGTWTGYDRLNYTLISEILDVNEEYKYHTCRYRFNPLYYLDKECQQKNDPYDLTWKYGQFPEPCADTMIGCFQENCKARLHGVSNRILKRIFLYFRNLKEMDIFIPSYVSYTHINLNPGKCVPNQF